MEQAAIQACLNGSRKRNEQLAVAITPTELAEEGPMAVETGTSSPHIYPRGPETLEPDARATALCVVRAACPGIPILFVITSLSAETDPVAAYT